MGSPYLHPPGETHRIPPLFHLILAGLSTLFNISPFDVARGLQPIFAFSMVISITFVTYRFYGLTAAIAAGILTVYSFITFNRALMVTPGTLSLIIMPLALYTYYIAQEKVNYKFLVVLGILTGAIFLTHTLTGFCLLIVLMLYTLTIRIFGRNIKLKYLGITLLITLLTASTWWAVLYLMYQPKFNFLPYDTPIIYYYLRYLGVFPTLLAVAGFVVLLEKRENKDILVLIWASSILMLSQVYLVGLQIESLRLMEVGSYPMIIIAGVGMTYIIAYLQKHWENLDIIIFLVKFFCYSQSSQPSLEQCLPTVTPPLWLMTMKTIFSSMKSIYSSIHWTTMPNLL